VNDKALFKLIVSRNNKKKNKTDNNQTGHKKTPTKYITKITVKIG